jgi:hypothetical protein
MEFSFGDVGAFGKTNAADEQCAQSCVSAKHKVA